MRLIEMRKVSLLVVFIVMAHPLKAVSVRELTAAELVSGSSRIILGTAISQSTERDANNLVWTNTTIQVTETLKGGTVQTYIVRQYGGVIGNVGYTIPGIGAIRAGEEYLLLLDATASITPVRGVNQGLFRIRGSAVYDAFGQSVHWVGGNIPLQREDSGPPDSSVPETFASLRTHILALLKNSESSKSAVFRESDSNPAAAFSGLAFGDFSIIECVPGSGNPVKGWQNKQLHLAAQPTIVDVGPGQLWLTGLARAVANWVVFNDSFQMTFRTGGSSTIAAGDRENTIGLSPIFLDGGDWPDNILGITEISYSVPDCYILESDTLINPGAPLATNEPNQISNFRAYDFQAIAGHEIGHAFGLDHSDGLTNGSIMYAHLSLGDTRRVSPSDKHGLAFLYGTAGPAPPRIFTGGVVNGASFFGPYLAPGEIATIFGSKFSNVAGVFQSTGIPVPRSLFTTSATVGSFQAPLFALANTSGLEQINIQVPWEVAGTQTTVGVGIDPTLGSVVSAPLLPAYPGIFTLDGTIGVITHNNTGALVTAQNPAERGELICIYATGLGKVSNQPATGAPALASPLSSTLLTPIVSIGGITSNVQFSGLAPGFVGLNQVNVFVPTNAPSGSVDVSIRIGTQPSNTAKMSVQ